MKQFIRVFVTSIFVLGGILSPIASTPISQAQSVDINATTGPICRYGLDSAYPISTISQSDLASLRFGNYLDWGTGNGPTLPTGVKYIQVLRVGGELGGPEDYYTDSLNSVTTLVPAHPGAYWIIGNEPDTQYTYVLEDDSEHYQDNLTAEEYASRYYALASQIRLLDPTAKIGFGSIVQATPLRIRYLTRAWEALIDLDPDAPDELVDFFAIHGFILNEFPNEPNNWGTGVPKGFETDYADAEIITIEQKAVTYDSNRFMDRVQRMRSWMNAKGQREKPLWVTEYGSVFPPVDPVGEDLVNVSDANTATFMTATFEKMSTTTSSTLGMPADGNRLVQRWFWYSLADYPYRFGGTLYDVGAEAKRTTIWNAYQNATALINTTVDLSFDSAYQVEVIPGTPNKIKITFQLLNSGSSDVSGATVTVYQGNPINNIDLSSMTTTSVWGCGSSTMFTIEFDQPEDFQGYFYLTVAHASDPISNNNTKLIPWGFDNFIYLPIISR